jgi:hypothetical protein
VPTLYVPARAPSAAAMNAAQRRPLSVEQKAAEDGHHSGLAVWVLPRAVDVAEAQDDVRHPVETAPRRDVGLARQLGRTVRRQRLGREGLARRARRSVAVEPTARRREHNGRAAPARGLADVQRSDDVRRAVEHRVCDRDRDAGLRGEVTDDVDAGLERTVQGIRVGDIESLERCVLGNVLAPPGRKIVDDQHVVAPGEERICHVRPNEPGSSSHENARHVACEYAPIAVGAAATALSQLDLRRAPRVVDHVREDALEIE